MATATAEWLTRQRTWGTVHNRQRSIDKVLVIRPGGRRLQRRIARWHDAIEPSKHVHQPVSKAWLNRSLFMNGQCLHRQAALRHDDGQTRGPVEALHSHNRPLPRPSSRPWPCLSISPLALPLSPSALPPRPWPCLSRPWPSPGPLSPLDPPPCALAPHMAAVVTGTPTM